MRAIDHEVVRAAAMTPADHAQLRLDEAVELCTAWVDQLAQSLEARALVIKGDTLARQGLRASRVSADVDVLVDPVRFDDCRAALVRAGWEERPLPFISSRVSPHSVTFIRSGWPCDIDLHSHFPGFLADPGLVFDELWSRRSSVVFADRAVSVPDRMTSLLISALHAYRDGTSSRRAEADLATLREVELSDTERAALGSLAAATGCDGSLKEFLLGMNVPVRPVDSPALREWRARVASQTQGAFPWLRLWQTSSWRQRPGIAWRAFWPTNRDILLAHPSVEDRTVPRLMARVRRLWRGLRGLPQSVSAIRSQK